MTTYIDIPFDDSLSTLMPT